MTEVELLAAAGVDNEAGVDGDNDTAASDGDNSTETLFAYTAQIIYPDGLYFRCNLELPSLQLRSYHQFLWYR